MPVLGAILQLHAPLLIIDTASARVQVGLLQADGAARWRDLTEEAGTGIFRCLAALEIDLATVRSFAFCEGPGSILGIRTTAMLLRTWNVLAERPVFAFQSLGVVAHALGRAEISVIADARRDSWHCVTVNGQGVVSDLHRVPAAELTGALIMPEGFKHWTPLPTRSVERVPYLLANLLPKITTRELFRQVSEPDAFLHEEPAYLTWTPTVHRAPGKA